MSRSLWKAPFSGEQLDQLSSKARRAPARRLSRSDLERRAYKVEKRVWSRASTILPADLGRQVQVHNGKNWVRVQVSEEMIAHKYGEFASTRKKNMHKSKSSKKSG